MLKLGLVYFFLVQPLDDLPEHIHQLVFQFLQKAGNVSDAEMLRTFNNGIGMIAVVPEDGAQEVMERLTVMKEKAFIIGEIVERKTARSQVKWVKGD